MRYQRRWPLVVATLVSFALVAGCSDNKDDARRADTKVELSNRQSQGAACALLDDAALDHLFPGDVPEPSGSSMGEGFAECEWAAKGDGPLVLVSKLPAADFRNDYLKQLTVTAPVAGVGDRAVSFPGLVGIGRGSAGGGSVGFTSGDTAVIVAVRATGNPTRDAAQATALAKQIERNL
jgi:hypothetical protein